MKVELWRDEWWPFIEVRKTKEDTEKRYHKIVEIDDELYERWVKVSTEMGEINGKLIGILSAAEKDAKN